MNETMTVEIKLFGSFRDFSKTETVTLLVLRESKVTQIRTELLKKLGEVSSDSRLADVLSKSAFADEANILSDSETVKDGARLAILPPVCGG